MSGVRQATHAGSWYTSNGGALKDELQGNLDRVTPIPQLGYSPPVGDAKAIIAPHAGYSYSGPAAAWAYAAIPTEKIKRVVLLGPSHHAYIPGIALSPFASYGTPLGDIPLDLQAVKELERSGLFQRARPGVDEDEHSLEMHLPYIRHVFSGRDDLTLVPMIVGQPGRDPVAISKVLQKFWEDEETFFIISSDFCHWGSRFRHTPYYPSAPNPPNPVPPVKSDSTTSPSVAPTPGQALALDKKFSRASAETPIWKSIQYMDHEGMDILRTPAETRTLDKWHDYLDRTKNTICGRNPITVLLQLVQYLYPAGSSGAKPEFTFVRYEQSSKCYSGSDSSVSYVSGVLRVPKA